MCAEVTAKTVRDSEGVVGGMLEKIRSSVQEFLSQLQSRLLHIHGASSASKAADTLQVCLASAQGNHVKMQCQLHRQFSTFGYWTASVQRRSAGGEEGEWTFMPTTESVWMLMPTTDSSYNFTFSY